jgi:hypothetical protein
MPLAAAVDQLVGPLCHRAPLVGDPVDDVLLDAVAVDGVVQTG